jgi:hypothetical protein
VKFFNTFDFIENFFPNTPIAFLLYLFFFFFITTIFVLIIYKLSKKEEKELKKNIKKEITINDLLKIVKNKNSTIQDLAFALEYFNENFKVSNFPDKAFDFFKHLLTHKNRNKILFDIFHNKTVKLNKDFEDQLNKIEKDALNEN